MKYPIALAAVLLGCCAVFVNPVAAEPPRPDTPVGPVDGGGTKLPDGQTVRPAGQSISYGGRPLDLCLSADRSLLFVKNAGGLSVIDVKRWQLVQSLPYDEDSGSMHGIVNFRDSKTGVEKVYVTGSYKHLMEATAGVGGTLNWTRSIALSGPGGKAHATGIAVTKDGSRAYVCLSRSNTLAVIDLVAGTVLKEISVGVCPYGVVLAPDESDAYVTNFGGRRAKIGDVVAGSTGTPVVVGERGVAATGTVSVVDLVKQVVKSEIAVGLHPGQIIASRDGATLFVANANSDSISVIDRAAGKVTGAIDVKPDDKLPFGSVVNALALSPDGRTLYCANAGNNAVAVIGLEGNKGVVRGFVPTAWFPGGIVCDDKNIFIANVKGEGSRQGAVGALKWDSSQIRGTVSKVGFPTAAELAEYTERAKADARVPQSLRAMEQSVAAVPPVAVPVRFGEPGSIKHIIYVIKENRTYDQVFGDIPKGNGDPKLCTFGRNVTPNHHALAEQFVLLDNYYCNGVVSADGHQWATQGMVTDYQEKGFGGHTRSYDFGTDALCYANCNFIWDSVLLHGLSFRNYGEFDFPEVISNQPTWFDVHRDWKAGKVKFTQSVELAALNKYTCQDYPGWQLRIPDVCRMEVFLKEFAQFEKSGDFPNLVIVYLPQDHTQGTKQSVPTPRAHLADNDLALGQLVDAVSHSRFWGNSCIFVNEDDPQNGYDHVDGHRSICLVISPFTKRGSVVSRFYNQTSVLHTITRMLGLPPLNQLVAQAPTMEDCFTDKPDLRPYAALANLIALDERNKPREAMTPLSQGLHDAVAKMDFSRPDRIDDDGMNRLIWSTAHAAPYPSELAGAHGKGLITLHLKLNAERDVDDDDD